MDTDDFAAAPPNLEDAPLTTHCNSPLKFSTARAALLRPATCQYISARNPAREEWKVISKLHRFDRIQGFDSAFHQNEIMTKLSIKIHSLDHKDWQVQQDNARDMWALNLQVLHDVGPSGLPESMPSLSSAEATSLLSLYALRSFWEEGVLVSGGPFNNHTKYWQRLADSNIWEASSSGFQFYAGKRIFVIISPRGVSLLSRDHLVVLSDLVAQRYILTQSVILDTLIGKTTFPPGFLEALFVNGDRILEAGGNEAYRVIYNLEASCSARLVGDIKLGSPSGKTYLEKVTEEGMERARATNTVALYMEREVLISSIASNPNLLAQCFGLYRLWGHPTIEPLHGAAALKAISTSVRIASHEHIEAISNKFKEEFVTRFYAQKQAWPDLDVSELSPTNVIREAYQNLAPVPTDHKNYRRGHWSLVKFRQCFPVDPKFELLEVLSDKALSLDTLSLAQNVSAGKGPGSSVDRALIMRWLQSSFVDPQEFLKMVDKDGFTSLERSVGLREKEREGKLDARMFGLMTFIKRMYIVLTEALIAEHIIPLFPEITMTDDELSLDKKRLAFTRISSSQFRLFTSLDFSKWNSNMRKEETLPLFQSFDELFGFSNVFQRTHEMFEDSFMYLLNGSYTPRLENGRFVPTLGSWYGHLGGIEGLRQKGWTVWTILLIMICAEGSLMKLKLMGQGDNQILLMVFPKHLPESDCMKDYYRFMRTLQSTLDVIGPPLKLEETWTSKDLFVYGKYFIHKGVALESSYKRICRMFKMSNEDFPTLESAVSSMTANVSAALSCSASIGSEFFVYITELTGLFQLFLTVPYLHKFSPLTQLSQPGNIRIPGLPPLPTGPVLTASDMEQASFYMKILLLPRCLGGLPVLSLPQLIIRGFPDDLSMAISFLKSAYRFVTPPIKRYISRILSPHFNPAGSFTLLLENPTALNLRVPSSPGEARRSSILKFLRDDFHIRNRYFREFLDILDSKEEASLLKFLQACRPCNPVVLSAIYDATACARARRVVGKLQKTRTISKVAIVEGQVDLFDVIRASEINHLRSVLYLIKRRDKGPIVWEPNKCSVTHAKDLRNEGWGVDIVGVDCAPPLEVMIIEENTPSALCRPGSELDKGFISVLIPFNMTGDDLANPLLTGPYYPYRGSATRQKIMGHGSTIASYSSPLIAKAMKLGALIGWATELDSAMCRVIELVIKSLTDVPLNLLLPLDADAGGSVHHRFEDDRIEKGGAVGVLPNFGTKMMFITNYLVAYSKGSKNVNFMFQPVMAFASVLLGTYFRHSGHSHFHPFHIHIARSCCIQPVDESFIDGPWMPVSLPIRSQNPFLFIPKDKAIPPTLKVQVFPSHISSTSNPAELTNRLIGALGFRVFQVLETPSWSTHHYSPAKPGIMINWAFRAPLLKVLETVALLLLTFFSNQCHDKTPTQFIRIVTERVTRSGLEAWGGLSNLIHCPNFHHELVQEPYGVSLVGNPEMSDSILSINIRNTVIAILAYWSTSPLETHPLNQVEVRLPPACGVITHPAMVLAMKRWCLGQHKRDLIHVRNAIVATLNSAVLARGDSFESDVAMDLISEGSNLIFPETIDSLCKKAPELPPLQEEPRVAMVRPAHYIIGRLQRSYRKRDQIEVGELPPMPRKRTYKSHQYKIAPSPTTGPYKGLSLFSEFRNSNPQKILCCGDGAGGFTLAALLTFPYSEVFFNTLITSLNPIQQAPIIPYLPSLAGHPGLEKRLRHLDLTNDNISDLTSPDYEIMFTTKMSTWVDMVVCDAECPGYLQGSFPILLADRVARLSFATRAKAVIFKTYALSLEVLACQVSCFMAFYEYVSVVRCHFSNQDNTEVYLIMTMPSSPQGLRILESGVSGLVISPLMMASACSRAFNVTGVPWADYFAEYSAAIDPLWQESFGSRLGAAAPFIMDETQRVYPESCMRWALSTCTVIRGTKAIKRSVVRTSWFTKRVISRLALQFLILYSLVDGRNWDQVLEEWDDFKIVWYRSPGGRWALMLTCAELSPELLKACRAWKIPDILAPQTKKYINQLVGIHSQLGFTVVGPSLYPEGWTLTGPLGRPEDPVVQKFLIERMLSYTPPS